MARADEKATEHYADGILSKCKPCAVEIAEFVGRPMETWNDAKYGIYFIPRAIPYQFPLQQKCSIRVSPSSYISTTVCASATDLPKVITVDF